MLEKGLLERLEEYASSDAYPFHMPGHKRRVDGAYALHFPNPYGIDITEIYGFDNLHHPEGILKDSMEWASGIYGADQTYYLVGGSSCGVLSAVCGTVCHGGRILMSRNCHKSAYHGVFLNHLSTEYIYPQILPGLGIQGGLSAEDVERLLISCREIQAVLVVSPTYDGIVSDIRAIAGVAHAHGLPLIVDEAHGAHFIYGDSFPASALELGADVVIQSLHKTLPAFTQSAVMHIKKGYVDIERIDRYVHMFQSSSPSYVLMAGIENCIRFMDGEGREQMRIFGKRLTKLRDQLGRMKYLKLLSEEWIGRYGVYDLDRSKIVVSSAGTGMSGLELESLLRERYDLEMEMCGADYVTAITTLADTQAGLIRLEKALMEIDGGMGAGRQQRGKHSPVGNGRERGDEKAAVYVEKSIDRESVYDERLSVDRVFVSEEEIDIDREWGDGERNVTDRKLVSCKRTAIASKPLVDKEMVPDGKSGSNEGGSIDRLPNSDKKYLIDRQSVEDGIRADYEEPEICMTISEAMDSSYEVVSVEESGGAVSAEFVYVYPPGIPIIAPGERIRPGAALLISRYRRLGLAVQGMADATAGTIRVLASPDRGSQLINKET